MPDQRRWGWSALSKSNFADAYKEEVMVDKTTGEMLIRTPQGDIISYGFSARLRQAVDSMYQFSLLYGLYEPTILMVRTTVPLPKVVLGATNILLDDTVSITPATETNKVFVYMDTDAFVSLDGQIAVNVNDIHISGEMSIVYSDGGGNVETRIVNASTDLDALNSMMFTIPTIDGYNITNFTLTSLTITPAPGAHTGDVMRYIVNNILIAHN